jgi:hypothetical protein
MLVPEGSRGTPPGLGCGAVPDQDRALVRAAAYALSADPGVNDPTAIPASRQPTSGGRRSLLARKPPAKARTKLVTIVAMSVVPWP